MESLEYIFNTHDLPNIHELSTETPIGWSSICLDQTIHYYMDCNSTLVEDIQNEINQNMPGQS